MKAKWTYLNTSHDDSNPATMISQGNSVPVHIMAENNDLKWRWNYKINTEKDVYKIEKNGTAIMDWYELRKVQFYYITILLTCRHPDLNEYLSGITPKTCPPKCNVINKTVKARLLTSSNACAPILLPPSCQSLTN